MQLWNDYEGKKIAEAYTLGKLFRPEGRTALFTLPEGLDGPSIVRLTESLNDEGQMLTCWRRVSEINHNNLLGLKRFGDTVFEGTPLTYAVMEAPDASLAELLAERPMTHAEAMQVASSIVPALKALHQSDLVHAHIVPENIVAVGETVKLRADCVRECKVDADLVTAQDCASMRQRDVEALGLLLLRALTLEKRLRPGLVLPAPFDRIIANALNGMWGLTEIAAVLPAAVAPPAPKPAHNATPSAPVTVASRPAMKPDALATPVNRLATPEAEPVSAPAAAPKSAAVVDPPLMFQRRIQATVAKRRKKGPIFAAIAVAAAVLLAIFLRAFHNSGTPAAPTPTVARVQAPAPAPQNTAPRVAATATEEPVMPATADAASSRSEEVAGATGRLQPGWYVIVYTFNHEQQALQRAEAIMQRYPRLHPQVITPHGRSFLITLGGAMSRDEAESIRDMARQAGMPHDTYVRNYGS